MSAARRKDEQNIADFIFYHNGLSDSNAIVEPQSFKFITIVDWEYGGFYPLMPEFSFIGDPAVDVCFRRRL